MTRHFAILLAAALLSAAPAWAAETGIPDVDQATSAVKQQRVAVNRSRAALVEARAKYESLGEAIAAKKAAGGEVSELLRASLTAGRTLDNEAQRRDSAVADLGVSIEAAIASIDQNIELQRPGLKRGSRRERARVARLLRTLIGARNDMKAQLAELARTRAPSRRAWAEYEVQADPLDGPDELGAKADFLDDTRDKFLAKRRALSELIADARQERDIARASANFRTDRSHFDDSVRVGRVTRRGTPSRAITISGKNEGPEAHQRTTGAAGDGNQPADVAAGARQPGDDAPNQGAPPPAPAAPPMEPDANLSGQAPQAGFEGANQQDSDNNRAADPSGGGGAAPVPPTNEAQPTVPTLSVAAPVAGQASLPRQIDADLLLNLNVHDLDVSQVDVTELESLLENLTLLDAYLGQRAEKLRTAAEQLDADEAESLGR